MKECPLCKQVVPAGAVSCKCGYDFVTGRCSAPNPERSAQTSPSSSDAEFENSLIGSNSKRRLFAAAVDNLVASVAALALGKLAGEASSEMGWLVAALVYFLYFASSEGLWSRTIGKLLFGLKVVSAEGDRCGWVAVLIRTGLRVFEANPALLGVLPGGIVVALTKRNQRIGDLLGRTLVVETTSPAGRAERP